MLTELCGELNNWFDRDTPRYAGDVKIENGFVDIGSFRETIQVGQYYRIIGSVFNDGVWKYTGTADEGLVDESFIGSVHLMAVPKQVIQLAQDIAGWETKYGAQAMSPFASESLSSSSYSYTKASASSDGDGSAGWQKAFSKQLSRWRKIRP